MIVNDGGQAEVDVVLGHADLLGHLHDLDPDVDLDQPLAERIDADEPGVGGAVESAEFGDEPDVPLLDGSTLGSRSVRCSTVRRGTVCRALKCEAHEPEGVGAADHTRDGSTGSHDTPERVDHRPIPSVVSGVIVGAQLMSIAGLEIFAPDRLDFDQRFARSMRRRPPVVCSVVALRAGVDRCCLRDRGGAVGSGLHREC